MKGIVLVGWSGTGFYPITGAISKQLIPIYDKPMIYYPIYTLMEAGVKEILLITTKEDQAELKKIFNKGEKFGLNISYAIQDGPEDLAQAFMIGKDFIGYDDVVMILGNNIFYGDNLKKILETAKYNLRWEESTIFAKEVKDPERFGVVEFDQSNNVLSIEEKPIFPRSNYAITGMYFYPNDVFDKAFTLNKSDRCQYEITDLNLKYLNEKRLKIERLDNVKWFDIGTFDSMMEASLDIQNYEKENKRIVACLEEISYNNGWIDKDILERRINIMKKNNYGKYLKKIL